MQGDQTASRPGRWRRDAVTEGAMRTGLPCPATMFAWSPSPCRRIFDQLANASLGCSVGLNSDAIMPERSIRVASSPSRRKLRPSISGLAAAGQERVEDHLAPPATRVLQQPRDHRQHARVTDPKTERQAHIPCHPLEQLDFAHRHPCRILTRPLVEFERQDAAAARTRPSCHRRRPARRSRCRASSRWRRRMSPSRNACPRRGAPACTFDHRRHRRPCAAAFGDLNLDEAGDGFAPMAGRYARQ